MADRRSGRIDETQLRRQTGIIRPEASPGTPGDTTGKGGLLRVVGTTDIGQQKFTRRFERLLKLSQASGLDGYVTDMLPILAFNRFGPEDFAPEEVLCGATVDIAAGGAGNRSQAFLRNPNGSGVIGIIDIVNGDGVMASKQTAAGKVFFETRALSPIVAPVAGAVRDTRVGGPPTASAVSQGKLVLDSNNAVPALVNGFPVWIDISGIKTPVARLGASVILAPGSELCIFGDLDAEELVVAAAWRERLL